MGLRGSASRRGVQGTLDGGQQWGDLQPPFWQFALLDNHVADACSDPTATFDSRGNAYVGGVLFEVFFADSAFLVTKSNAPIGGAFYHTPRPLSFQTYRANPPGVVAKRPMSAGWSAWEKLMAVVKPSVPGPAAPGTALELGSKPVASL